ncbi:MAG: DUF3090 family protein [Streptosporangiales bacterium]|nr:DUF3090 family protein [Streptosporangiales bacterium]
MPRQVFNFDHPERFVAGTVGEPGDRAFYLQARTGSRVTSVVLEKVQVTLLAEKLEELLDEVLRATGGAAPIPAMPPAGSEDLEPLDQPILEEFRVAKLTLAWDADNESVVIEAEAPGGETEEEEEDEEEPAPAPPPTDEDEGPDLLRVYLDPGAARAFSKRAQALVNAGRPACPFCGLPLDTEGHVCPRTNGKRPAT